MASSQAGRLIGYLLGWVTPPPASELAAVGYTQYLQPWNY
jgi:hypothetical protein